MAEKESQKSAATTTTVTGQKQERDKDSKKGPTVRTRQQKGTAQKDKKHEKNDTETDDSTDEAYEPAKDSDTEETSSEDDSSAVKHPAKKRKLSASPSKTKSPPATQTTSSPSASSKVSGTRSHHQKKACPVSNCTFNGNDLRRHLQVHVKKGELAADSIDKLLAIVKAGNEQRGKMQKKKGRNPMKGRKKHWCPVPGCNQVVIDVGRHLCNQTMHGMKKDSREYQRMVRMAKPYSGLQELQDSLVPPPPPIVELTFSEGEVASLKQTNSDSQSVTTHEPTEADDDNEVIETADAPDEVHSAGKADSSDKAESPGDTRAGPSQESAGGNESSEDDYSPGGQEETSEDDEEDDDCSTTSQPSCIQFFTDTKAKSNRHRWLVQFFEHLTRPTAGDKKQTIRLQHATQMRKLLEAIDPGGDDILCLLDHEGDAVWKLWVKPNLVEKKKKPGTIISYLTSYEKFLKFVTHARFSATAPPLHPDYVKDFESVKEDLKGWRSTVDSQSHEVKNKRFVDETEGLLTLQELEQIKSSRPYNEAIKLLIQAGQGKELDLKESLAVRDFLLTRFSLDTGTRPGPLNNSTLEEFSSGKVQNGCKVMLVAKHKRAKDGPAICPMLPELYKFMNTYVKKIRPYFAKPDEEALFITNEGRGFREGTIGRRLSVFVEKCGVRLGPRMAFVDMRKVISTQMLKNATPEEKAILRRVLAHSEKTSREWYTRPDLTNVGIEAANIIQRLLATSASAKEAAESSPPPSPERDVLGPSNIGEEEKEVDSHGQDPQGQKQRSSPRRRASSSKAAECSKSSAKETSSFASGFVPPTPEVKTLSELQKGQIKKTFQKEIQSHITVTMDLVQSRMSLNTILNGLSTSRGRVKQVVNFVNHLVGKGKKAVTLPEDQPTGKGKVTHWMDAFDTPSTRSSGRRTEWDEKDTQRLEKAFSKHTKLPSTSAIRAIMDNDEHLRAIKEREGWDRVYNKLKNIFRKK